jgi:PAS domain S-box-containing protein
VAREPSTRSRSEPRGRDADPASLPAGAVDALLGLSRGLAAARTEGEISGALARALEAFFPERAFAIRLFDPRTLALTTLYARGRLRPTARDGLTLRRRAVERIGLSAEALRERGFTLVEEDVPIFEGCDRARVVPLATRGQLFGVVHLEYGAGSPGDPAADAGLLKLLANQAACGVRNLRSIEELTFLKTYLEDLIEHANALILAVDRGRRVTVWNGALVALTGASKAAAIGAPPLDRVVPDDRPRAEAALDAGLAGEAADGVLLRLFRAGGGEAPVALNTAPIHGASGEVEGVLAIGHDLTALRSAQAAAEHAERLAGIGRVVAGVVHELNNPLTAVTMYADALIEKLAARGHDPVDVEKLRAIQEGGWRIQRLARDLIAYARPSGARTEPVDLGEVIDEAVRMAKPAIKESGAALVRDPVAAPRVEANRPSLVQVVVALVTNAAQAVRAGGRIRVGVAAAADAVRLTVADDGPGMPPEVEARAFEPFFTTRPGTGIGLGLPTVLGIVERHRGRVALETAPGKGTTVTVTLPLEARYPPSDSTA